MYNTDGETSCHCPLTTINIFPLSEAETCGSPDTTTLPVPIRDGYAFAGYYDGINIVSNDITNIQNIEYVANWSTNTYKSNFYYGSNYIKSSYNLYNTMVTVPSISTEDLGLSSWFTYINGYVDTEGWIQKETLAYCKFSQFR